MPLYVLTHDVDTSIINKIDINANEDFVWTNLKISTDYGEIIQELKVLYRKLDGLTFKFCSFQIACYKIVGSSYVFDSYIPIDMDKVKSN
jgi:hypothetical protein